MPKKSAYCNPLPWYETEADFKAVLALFPPEQTALAGSYAEALQMIKLTERAAKFGGGRTRRVAIKADIFQRWCGEHALPLKIESLLDYIRSLSLPQKHPLERERLPGDGVPLKEA